MPPKGLPETPHGLTKVFLDFLPKNSPTLQEDLQKFFGCGKIIKLLKKPGKTYGYAVFRQPNSARVALTHDGKDFAGRRIRVEIPKGITDVDKPRKQTYRDRVRDLKGVDPQRQVYVSGLAGPVNEDILRDVVVQNCGQGEAGQIESFKFFKGKGSCFITLATVDAAGAVAEGLNNVPLLGRTLQSAVAEAPGQFQKPQKAVAAAAMPAGVRRRNVVAVDVDDAAEAPAPAAPCPPGCKRVLVGGLPEDATKEDVVGALQKCGAVVEARILRHRLTGAPLGLASVTFSHGRAAREAVALSDSLEVRRSTLQIEYDADASQPAPAQPRGRNPAGKLRAGSRQKVARPAGKRGRSVSEASEKGHSHPAKRPRSRSSAKRRS